MTAGVAPGVVGVPTAVSRVDAKCAVWARVWRESRDLREIRVNTRVGFALARP